MFIDNELLCTPCERQRAYIYFYKYDEITGAAVAGAEFVLEDVISGRVRYAVSDECGEVRFPLAYCTGYLLREFRPAQGYRADRGEYRIFADRCGAVKVNGCRTKSFAILGERVAEE